MQTSNPSKQKLKWAESSSWKGSSKDQQNQEWTGQRSTIYDRLSFVFLVIKSSKSRDTLKRKNEEENDEVEETRFSKPGLKKKTIAERKIELLSKCTEAITKNPVESADSKHLAVALYADEKLSQVGKRDRRIAEKRISDVLFEVEMQSEREEPVNRQMMYGSYGNNSYLIVNTTPLQGQSYMEMLNNPLQKSFLTIIYT